MLALALGALTGATLQTRGHEDVILMVMIVCLIAVIVMMIPHVHSDARWVTGNTDSYKNGRRWALLTGTGEIIRSAPYVVANLTVS